MVVILKCIQELARIFLNACYHFKVDHCDRCGLEDGCSRRCVATCWPVETHVRSLAAAPPLSVCRSQTLDDKRRYRHR